MMACLIGSEAVEVGVKKWRRGARGPCVRKFSKLVR